MSMAQDRVVVNSQRVIKTKGFLVDFLSSDEQRLNLLKQCEGGSSNMKLYLCSCKRQAGTMPLAPHDFGPDRNQADLMVEPSVDPCPASFVTLSNQRQKAKCISLRSV